MNNPAIGSSFDSFLDDEGIREEVQSGAVKKLIAFQLQSALTEQHLTKTDLAAQLGTSRAAVNRLLDPDNQSVTLSTLQKAATVLGKHLRLELV